MTKKQPRRKRIIENVHIKSLWYGGIGIAEGEDGKKILVKGALPDSVVDVRIVKKKRDYVLAHITKVHSMDEKWMDAEVRCPHYFFPYRCEDLSSPQIPPDPLFPLQKGEAMRGEPHHQVSKIGCGWCKWQGMSYERQLELKQDILEGCFTPLRSQIDTLEILPIIPSPLQFWYRNKIEFSFGKYLKRYPSPPNPPLSQGTISSVKNGIHLVSTTPRASSLGEGGEIDCQERWQKKGFQIAEHRQLGFHKQGEFSKIVDIDQCYLVSEKMHKIYAYIKQQLQRSKLPVHDAKTHQWLLRHLVIREGVHTGHILVNLAIAAKHFEVYTKDKKIWEHLLSAWKKDLFLQKQVTTFVVTENNGLADIVRWQDSVSFVIRWEGRIFEELRMNYKHHPEFFVEGSHGLTITAACAGQKESSPWQKRKITWFEKNYKKRNNAQKSNIVDSLHLISSASLSDCISIKFQISPFSFFQTNTRGAEVLFTVWVEMLGAVKWNLIDLYCGSGTIGLSFLKLGIWQKVIGIDVVESAIQDAKYNAKINGLSERAAFYCGRVENEIKWDVSTIQSNTLPFNEFFIGGDAIIIDPPREWLHPKVVAFLISLREKKKYKLLYISCNPTTMARDISLFVAWWFSIWDIQPVDMFPQTHHVECVGLLIE